MFFQQERGLLAAARIGPVYKSAQGPSVVAAEHCHVRCGVDCQGLDLAPSPGGGADAETYIVEHGVEELVRVLLEPARSR